MSGSIPQPVEPGAGSPVDPVAPIDRTGGYLGPNVAAAVVAASRATPARWRLLLRKATFWVGASIVLFWVVCAVFVVLFAPFNPPALNRLAATPSPHEVYTFCSNPITVHASRRPSPPP